ncbi:MAG TPA: translation elongation factor Ts [Limnochordales bacterium]
MAQQITTEMIRALRERTGAGMMDVKRALEQAQGNEEEAIRILREKGLAQAAKRASRKALEGLVEAYVDAGRTRGALVEVNCETDFVAKTEEFRRLAAALARAVAEADRLAGSADGWDPRAERSAGQLDAVLALVLPELGGQTAAAALADTAARVGENVRLRRFAAFRASDGMLEAYVHGEGRIGVLLEVEVAPAEAAQHPQVRALVRDLAMQVAAFRAEYVERDQIPAEVLRREEEIYRTAARNEGRPEKVLDRIVAGRMEKFYQEVCLLEQPFMRDPGVRVAQHVERTAGSLGARVKVRRFARFERAEQLGASEAQGQES